MLLGCLIQRQRGNLLPVQVEIRSPRLLKIIRARNITVTRVRNRLENVARALQTIFVYPRTVIIIIIVEFSLIESRTRRATILRSAAYRCIPTQVKRYGTPFRRFHTKCPDCQTATRSFTLLAIRFDNGRPKRLYYNVDDIPRREHQLRVRNTRSKLYDVRRRIFSTLRPSTRISYNNYSFADVTVIRVAWDQYRGFSYFETTSVSLIFFLTNVFPIRVQIIIDVRFSGWLRPITRNTPVLCFRSFNPQKR